jgi:hypothetical protein
MTEKLIQKDLNSVKKDLIVLFAMDKQDEYHLQDVSFSLIRTVLESLNYTLKDEQNSSPSSCDWAKNFCYSIIDINGNKKWVIEGSLWYGDIIISKL